MLEQSNQSPKNKYIDNEVSLLDLWLIVWSRKWLILLLGPIAGIIGIYIALTSTVYYSAQILVSPTQSDTEGGGLSALAGQFGGLASMAGINLGKSGNLDTAIAILESRKFLSEFIAEEKLLSVLFSSEWDSENQTWLNPNERRGPSGRPTDSEAYQLFSGLLSISQDNKSGLVTLAISWTNPTQCKLWANALVDRLNKYMREEAKKETERNLKYLKEQLEKTQKIEIRESLYSIIESESKNAMLANAKEEYVFEIIDPATVPEVPFKPNKKMIVITAGILGGFAGILLCFLLHFIKVAKLHSIRNT
ncbi:Wzz/FepE/Etk N-terminal domain-containing protein [Puniceicoccaceae bacterium K14]|nr:Wzz/FepE/Etk N-terminal domain-containing protein [Puniceicoccaceae bacterium K14]